MRYAFPTDDGKTVGKVFGRARSFAIYEDGVPDPLILENGGASSEHGAGTGAVAFLAGKGVGFVFAPELGPKAAEAIKAAGIGSKTVDAGLSLEDAMAAMVSRAKSAF